MSTSPEQPVESRPPTASRLPPTDRKFPCKACGAKLDFDPSVRALHCPYCGATEQIAPTDATVEEHDYEDYLNHQAAHEVVVAGRTSETRCTGCGAIVLLEDNVATESCPFCGTHLEHDPAAAVAMIPPESLLPFKLAQRDAVAAFNRWIAGLWFAPSALKQLANLGQLAGVYVPFWTYDSMTYTWYSGLRGDDYTVTETYTETNAQGVAETKTRQVVHTNWTSVSGEVDHFFDDVLVCASKSLPRNLVDELQPWDITELQSFTPQYLAGFKTERYSLGLAEGFEQARGVMDDEIRRLCCRDIGGDHQQLKTVKTKHVGVTFKHLLLPIWLAVYRYRESTYRILVNARTGEVIGTRPYSWAKIAGAALAAAGLIAAIVYFASR